MILVSTGTVIVLSSEITIASQLHLVIMNLLNNVLHVIIVIATMSTIVLIPAETMNMERELPLRIADMSATQGVPSTVILGTIVKVIGWMVTIGDLMMATGHAVKRSVARNEHISFTAESSKDHSDQTDLPFKSVDS